MASVLGRGNPRNIESLRVRGEVTLGQYLIMIMLIVPLKFEYRKQGTSARDLA